MSTSISQIFTRHSFHTTPTYPLHYPLILSCKVGSSMQEALINIGNTDRCCATDTIKRQKAGGGTPFRMLKHRGT